MFEKRIRIICGHYGSGKSEVAVNISKYLAANSDFKKKALLDLDIINPYFRSVEKKKMMENLGIRVFSGSVDGLNQDLPSIPKETKSLIYNEEYDLVIDLGGEDTGARVIAAYKNDISNKNYDMFLIVNKYRPETDTLEKVLNYIELLEKASSLKITGIISNSHLLSYTEEENIVEGYKLAKIVSEKSGIPLIAVTCQKKFIEKLPEEIEKIVFPLEIELREKWMN